jgi:hypothetical protein
MILKTCRNQWRIHNFCMEDDQLQINYYRRKIPKPKYLHIYIINNKRYIHRVFTNLGNTEFLGQIMLE